MPNAAESGPQLPVRRFPPVFCVDEVRPAVLDGLQVQGTNVVATMIEHAVY